MVDHELMQLSTMLADWLAKNRVDNVNVYADEESEYAFYISVYDREENHYTAQGVRHGRDDG